MTTEYGVKYPSSSVASRTFPTRDEAEAVLEDYRVWGNHWKKLREDEWEDAVLVSREVSDWQSCESSERA